MDINMNEAALHGLLTDGHRKKSISIKTEPITDTYNVDPRPFARGKFATVRRCQHKVTGTEYAAKHIRKRRRAADVRHEILHEAHVLDMSDGHPHIVQLHEVYETPSEIILVLEMVPGGELQRVLDDEEVVPEREAARLMRQIMNGVAFLHDHRIAHLDLKPQNLLLTKPFPDCEVKLCDFGISKHITKGIEIREILGTPDYVAPEILHYEPISLPTDMWSIGILTYVLLSGHSPFGGDTKQETFCNITRGTLEFPLDLFETVSNTAKDFIQRLLVRNPSERMTAKECLSHPWLSQEEAPTIHRIEITLTPQAIRSPPYKENNNTRPTNDNNDRCMSPPALKDQPNLVTIRTEKKPVETIPIDVKCVVSKIKNKENVSQNHSAAHHESSKPLDQQTKKTNPVGRKSVDMMVAEFEGLKVTKSIIFSEEIIKDERVAIVF